jgi:hypothetical protein
VQNEGMTEDDNFLYDVASAGPEGFAVDLPTGRESFYRLQKNKYVERVPITPMPGDDDPLLCRITERGKQYLDKQLSRGQ